jgi:hypothetical protein
MNALECLMSAWSAAANKAVLDVVGVVMYLSFV